MSIEIKDDEENKQNKGWQGIVSSEILTNLDQDPDVILPIRYKHIHAGKVRETYQHPDNPDQLIMIATDRISTHDVVHKNRIPWKGKVLTTVSNFWFNYFKTQEATKGIPTQLIENAQFPADFPDQYKDKAIIVKKLHALPVEAIVREYLYGSALKDSKGNSYNPNTWKLFTGEYVWENLKKCSKFKEPLFTPSTKGKVDVNINFEDMAQIIKNRLKEKHPEHIDKAEQYAQQVKEYTLKMFTTARDYAATKGITIADTKFEFAIDDNGVLHIIDEMLTPDSSRFWDAESIEEGKEPISFDKQDTREYVAQTREERWQKEEKPSLELPNDIISKTQKRYTNLQEIFVG